jgi:uncharacterized protein (UPF0548 family)
MPEWPAATVVLPLSHTRTMDQFTSLPLTYTETGATAAAAPPPGYQGLQRSLELGFGRSVFERAGAALMSWQMHQRAGLGVVTDFPIATPGAAVLLSIGRPPFGLTMPCRVIYQVSDEQRQGFAYGTLPGHPESGEEFFVVTRDWDHRVMFTVRAFSRPATRLARLGGPLTRVAQDLATRRYLYALKSLAQQRD